MNSKRSRGGPPLYILRRGGGELGKRGINVGNGMSYKVGNALKNKIK